MEPKLTLIRYCVLTKELGQGAYVTRFTILSDQLRLQESRILDMYTAKNVKVLDTWIEGVRT